ncbi:bis(5'-nucleosyl)-tetraphosphatase [Candidatus Uabimicrobium amorphum]|uniref:Bis(5'-nucleosyl)-tetraphosphatase [asymmetrical] n=1 Tax=Uabimicrobium amorphum TaxID=2596890 RepID=A0A5S9IVZ6_UABAM|nr:NUDIX domain-containing protein [Candidatus Uabimicrobium amorphum]BBM88282.1 DNA mismatch repair protein MutT [Candidatus Uabimicrobium amorphum]
MKQVRSCGFLIFRREPREFLLLKHPHRYDFPKGHVDNGESDLQCALRELYEETGLTAENITIDGFSCETDYVTRYKRFGNQKVHKTVVIFLGWLEVETEIKLSEHGACEWFSWPTARKFKEKSVAGILQKINNYLC